MKKYFEKEKKAPARKRERRGPREGLGTC